MLMSQASFTPPTTAASSNPRMQVGTGRFSTFPYQSPGWPMAWRRSPVCRSDIESRFAHRVNKRRLNYESESELENYRWLGATRPCWRQQVAHVRAVGTSAGLEFSRSRPEKLTAAEFAPHAERRQVMPSISRLLTRNLHDVFGENDPARRRAAIDEIFTEDCVFYEPRGVYRGRDEIDRVAGAIKATHPDFRYQPIAGPEELGNGGPVPNGFWRPGGGPAFPRARFILAPDGRDS